ncbi:MAG: hypothetical protein V9G29_04400 [Burkholderiaceae bacterium]
MTTSPWAAPARDRPRVALGRLSGVARVGEDLGGTLTPETQSTINTSRDAKCTVGDDGCAAASRARRGAR